MSDSQHINILASSEVTDGEKHPVLILNYACLHLLDYAFDEAYFLILCLSRLGFT